MSRTRRVAWLAGLLLIVTIGAPGTTSQAHPDCGGAYAPGIVLVQLHHGYHLPHLTYHAATTAIPQIGVLAMRVAVGQECAALEMLRRDPWVAFAELDYGVRATGTFIPNDPAWSSQWGPTKIGMPTGWNITTGTPDVVIAVLDSGLQIGHNDLAGNLWTNPSEIPSNGHDDDGNDKVDDFWGWHFFHEWAWDGEKYSYLPRENNLVTDEFGHGTHTAGIAGAMINNGVGIAGIAGDSRLMVVRVLDQYGSGWYSDIAKGIIYAVDNGAHVINLSLGGEPSSQILQEAADYAWAHGVLLVAATGNDGGPVLYPAACDHVLAVAATNQDDNRGSFSNHGPQVDVAAPGMDIYSTWYRGNYFTQSGTSTAAPHVSGLAALVWSIRPDLNVRQMTEIITGTTADVNGGANVLPGWDEYLGWGRIDAGQAMSAATRTGDLHLASSPPQLTVGHSAVITATVPPISGTTSLLTFSANGGTISPTTTGVGDGVATATLVADLSPGMAVVTATTGAISGVLHVRLLPGPVRSVTLTSSSQQVWAGHSVALTLTATDGYGNPPLNGTAIEWRASQGMVTPAKSLFHEGAGRATFIADPVRGPAVITSSLGTELISVITIDVSFPHKHFLPIVIRGGGD